MHNLDVGEYETKRRYAHLIPVIVGIAGALTAALLLFPPWKETLDIPYRLHSQRALRLLGRRTQQSARKRVAKRNERFDLANPAKFRKRLGWFRGVSFSVSSFRVWCHFLSSLVNS